MKVTGIAITPPPSAADAPKATPELLASTLAKYSRSNEGIDTILGRVDWNNPDASVDAIFRFIDYGHASIGGLTGGIAMAVDDVSMYMAYKLFYFSQMCDGQESSTRYIEMTPKSLPDGSSLGLDTELAKEWDSLMTEAFERYQSEYKRLDDLATLHPELIRYPEGANEKVQTRIRKNYALDRARYFIPFATKTNIALVMSARMWALTIKQIEALPHPEAKELAQALRTQLAKFSPRLIKHAATDAAAEAQANQMTAHWTKAIVENGVPITNCPDKVAVSIDNTYPDFMGATQSFDEAFADKASRYSVAGEQLNRIFVRASWNSMPVAELRDLNRHRTGYRFSPMAPTGFYLPPEIDPTPHQDFLERYAAFVQKAVKSGPKAAAAWPYMMMLGTQVGFEHGQMGDKFVYEVELRTGMGAHFRYAEMVGAAAEAFFEKMPQAREFVQIGEAQPE